jgi:Protein of unknown function (DUF4232)
MSVRDWLVRWRPLSVMCAVAVGIGLAGSSAYAAGSAGSSARAAAGPRASAAGLVARAAVGPRASAAANCAAAHLEVWLGLGEGGGTAGSTFYPLEFSNVGHTACTLNGFPGVSAVAGGGGQIGPAASRNGQHHATVRLSPGATAHAILRVVDWGALCSHKVTAVALKVFAPGTTTAQEVPFSFGACAHRRVLVVGPVRSGVGIPGFTTS